MQQTKYILQKVSPLQPAKVQLRQCLWHSLHKGQQVPVQSQQRRRQLNPPSFYITKQNSWGLADPKTTPFLRCTYLQNTSLHMDQVPP